MAYVFQNADDLRQFIAENVLTSSEAQEILGVSRARINSLVKDGKLISIKEVSATKLFLKSDVEARKEEAQELKKKYRPYD